MFNLFGRKKRAVPLTIMSAPEPAPQPVARAKRAPVKRTIPTVNFDAQRVTAEVETEIRTVIAETPEIPETAREAIFEAALAGVRAGGDLFTISQAISEIPDVAIPKGRVGEICRLINRRASALMDRDRQTSLGITEAKWMYSGAPCYENYRTATDEDRARDATHRAANGQKFKVGQGMLINGRYVRPGQDPGCKCVAKSVIPGLD